MDNFEYSIQLNEREWAEFLRAAEECSLAPAALAAAEEEHSPGDTEDTAGRDCPRGGDSVTAAGPGGEPAPPGTVTAVPRGVVAAGDIALPCLQRGHPPELLRLPPPAMPSAQRRQPPRPPPAATTAGDTAQGTATGGGRDTEPPGAPEQGRDAGGGQVAQPAVVAQPEAPAASAPAEGWAEKSDVPSEPRGDPGPARVAPEGDRAGTEPSSPGGSPSVVRPKVPAQPRKSRRQRGPGAAEGDKDTATPAGAGKAPPGSPGSPRKGRGKDKAAKAALLRLGSEEAAENKRPVPGPGGDGPEPGAAPQKPRGKEPQSPGKTKATKAPKAGQAGGPGVRDTGIPTVPAAGIPTIPATGVPAIPAAGVPTIPAAGIPTITATGIPTIPAAGVPWAAAAEPPRAASPLCFAAGASARPNCLDVTWPEMYEYLFCDSQEEEEEELGSSPEGRRSPMQREISWPELYEYFFNEPEGSRKKGKAKERRRKKFSGLGHAGVQREAPSSAPGEDTVVIPVPDVYEHFPPQRPQTRMGWRGIFSVPPASEVKRALGALRSVLQRQMQLRGGQAPSPSQALVPRRSGEELALVPLGGAQVWPEDGDTALALAGAAEDPRVLSHKDMCLVFCAFASWAVKTSDLQAPDAWKTMFLASFGTLSAIRYFRRQVREGHPRT
ncbi:PERM1 protein, partial [Illadopsis cleaveri]|nr:PERM1 protein [Illadopsis cleaveri]